MKKDKIINHPEIKPSKENGIKRVIYTSSSVVYGDQDQALLLENMMPNPTSPYGLHKYIGELYCRMWSKIYGLETVSLRYFNAYGPRQSEEGAYALVIAKFLKQKREGIPFTISGDGEQTRDFIHVRDIVRANILAMEKEKVGKGEVINIGSGKNVSINKIAELIGGPVEHIAPTIEVRHTLADISRARQLLGWQPKITLEDGIKEFLNK